MKTLFYRSVAIILWLSYVLVFSDSLTYAQRIGTVVSAEALPDIVKKVQDSVVNIQTDRSYNLGYWAPISFVAQFFSDFFEDKNSPEKKFKFKSEGSGVIIDSSGLILTNEHVIADAETIQVILNNKKSVSGKVIGKNTEEDLALVKIESDESLQAIAQGDSEAIRVGEDVFAIGTPYGYSQTVTRGIVSATNRQLKNGDKVLFDNLIQTDAAINPGNSGGPLLNAKGEMIGMIRLEDWRAQNIGFAIPVNKIKAMIPELQTGQQSDAALQRFKDRFGFLPKASKDSDGHEYVSIAEVLPRSKAAKIGLKPEDRLQRFDKKMIVNLEDLLEEASKVHATQRVYFEFCRQERMFFTYIEVNS